MNWMLVPLHAPGIPALLRRVPALEPPPGGQDGVPCWWGSGHGGDWSLGMGKGHL